MACDRRFSVPMSVRIECRGNSFDESTTIKMSVRNQLISICIDGESDWPHMTPKQARRLAKWLAMGADEAEARKKRESAFWLGAEDATNGR